MKFDGGCLCVSVCRYTGACGQMSVSILSVCVQGVQTGCGHCIGMYRLISAGLGFRVCRQDFLQFQTADASTRLTLQGLQGLRINATTQHILRLSSSQKSLLPICLGVPTRCCNSRQQFCKLRWQLCQHLVCALGKKRFKHALSREKRSNRFDAINSSGLPEAAVYEMWLSSYAVSFRSGTGARRSSIARN